MEGTAFGKLNVGSFSQPLSPTIYYIGEKIERWAQNGQRLTSKNLRYPNGNFPRAFTA